jgi:hypothetical protein
MRRGTEAEPYLQADQKETGRLGPVSRASAGMRLHRSQLLAGFGVFRRRGSRPLLRLAPANVERSEDTQSILKQLWGQYYISCNGFCYLFKRQKRKPLY